MTDGNDPRNNPKIGDQIALYILTERVNELKESHRQKESRDMELFQQLTSNTKMLSERLLVVETNNEHVSNAIIKLQKESSLQTKILGSILAAILTGTITLIIKAIYG